MSFQTDRDYRGHPAEHILLELCRLRKLPAQLNPAPEEDYEGRAAYDLLIADIPVDVKSDWMSWHTRNIAVELASLEHTSSQAFIYALPQPSGLYFHVFDVETLHDLYYERVAVPRFDGTTHLPWKYVHKQVGDQEYNTAVLLPQDITKSVGTPFWAWGKSLTEKTQ